MGYGQLNDISNFLCFPKSNFLINPGSTRLSDPILSFDWTRQRHNILSSIITHSSAFNKHF